jgi:hypothetical protein
MKGESSMGKDFTVTITDPERAAWFECIFGTATIHVKSPIPETMNLPGKPHALAYMLDLELITDTQRHALVMHIANKFILPPGEVAATLDQNGVPILAEHCVVMVAHPQRWF